MKSNLTRRIAVVVQYVIGLGAFGFILYSSDLSKIVQLFRNIDLFGFVFLIAISVIAILCVFYTWHVVIQAVTEIKISTSISIGLIIFFVNNIFPSQLSGRSFAPVLISLKTNLSNKDSISLATFHTGIGALLYALMSSIGMVFLYTHISSGVLVLVLLSILMYIVAGVGILLFGLYLDEASFSLETVKEWFGGGPLVESVLNKVGGLFPTISSDSVETFRSLLSDHRLLFTYFVSWLIALVLIPGVRVWFLFDAFGASVDSLVVFPFYIVAAYSVSILPITPGGIGVTEATATAVLVALGFSIDIAASVVLIDRFLALYLPALVGWIPAVRTDLISLFD